jgi:uncharacterized protein (TIGR00369 family)
MTASDDTHDGGVDTASTPEWGGEQSRLITWRDPAATRTAATSMSGLAYWQAVAERRLPPPPISALMQMHVVDVQEGRITFNCQPDGSMYNALGMVHGGAACTILDTATGCALHTTLSRGVGFSTIEIKVNYLKAVTIASGTLTAVGTIVKAGSRIGFAEATLTDASGALVATATSTLLKLDLLSGAKPPNTNSKQS